MNHLAEISSQFYSSIFTYNHNTQSKNKINICIKRWYVWEIFIKLFYCIWLCCILCKFPYFSNEELDSERLVDQGQVHMKENWPLDQSLIVSSIDLQPLKNYMVYILILFLKCKSFKYVYTHTHICIYIFNVSNVCLLETFIYVNHDSSYLEHSSQIPKNKADTQMT